MAVGMTTDMGAAELLSCSDTVLQAECPVLSRLTFVRDETFEVTYMRYRGRQIKGTLLSTVCWWGVS